MKQLQKNTTNFSFVILAIIQITICIYNNNYKFIIYLHNLRVYYNINKFE